MLHLAPDESISNPEKYVGTVIPASKAQFEIKLRMGNNHQRLEYARATAPLADRFFPDRLEVFDEVTK